MTWENPYLNDGSDSLKTLRLRAYGVFFMMSNVNYLVWGRESKISLIHLKPYATGKRWEQRTIGKPWTGMPIQIKCDYLWWKQSVVAGGQQGVRERISAHRGTPNDAVKCTGIHWGDTLRPADYVPRYVGIRWLGNSSNKKEGWKIKGSS